MTTLKQQREGKQVVQRAAYRPTELARALGASASLIRLEAARGNLKTFRIGKAGL
jgi:hypothetical protein